MKTRWQRWLRAATAALCFWCVLWGVFWVLFIGTNYMIVVPLKLEIVGSLRVGSLCGLLFLVAIVAAIKTTRLWKMKMNEKRDAYHYAALIMSIPFALYLTPMPFTYVIM